MTRLMMSMTAVALGLAVAASVQAGSRESGRSGRSGPGQSGTSHWQGSTGHTTKSYDRASSYHGMNAKKFGHGYFYSGKHHNHWSYHCWDKRYGCDVYYDPGLCCYYYYCVPDCCYYPVSYCPYQRYCWETPAVASAPVPASATAVAVATASAGSNATAPAIPAPVAGR